MKNYCIILSVISIVLSFSSCNEKDDDKAIPQQNTQPTTDYLIFGHYYGMCMGEECVEIFQLDSSNLMEDSMDQYPVKKGFFQGKFVNHSSIKYNLVKDLINYFPDSLMLTNDTVIGCPDCADQGGLYIEYNFNSKHRYWMIDQSKTTVPTYLHGFMDKVNEKIKLINQ